MKENLQHKMIYILPAIVFILIPLGVVFVVNVAYKANIACLTLWRPADTLAFCRAYLSFAGTVILGSIAVYQNRKAQDINEQLQKLQQVKYVSMASAMRVRIDIRRRSDINYMYQGMLDANVIDLTAEGFTSEICFHIGVEFKNDSEYPIVQMQVHPGLRTTWSSPLYGMRDLVDQAVYIAKGETSTFQFIVPSEVFERKKEYGLRLSITFVNVFDFETPAALHILDLKNENKRNEYQYRLSKFTDIKSPSK